MKRKSMATLIGGLLSVCLIGVGFASWIIVQDDTETKEGTVHVEEVVDNSVYLETSWKDGKSTFNFTAPANTGFQDTDWLIANTEDANLQLLELTLDVSIINADKEMNSEIEVTWDTSSLAEYSKYVVPQAVSHIAIPAYDGSNSSWTVDDETGVKTYKTSVTISFEWGDYFGGKNPYAYFNSKKSYDKVDVVEEGVVDPTLTSAHKDVAGHDYNTWTWADEANYLLGELNKIDNYKTTLTLKAQAKRTAA